MKWFSFNFITIFLLGIVVNSFSQNNLDNDYGNIVIENAELKLTLSNKARALSLIHKPTGEECLQQGVETAVFSFTQYRPYDNEIFLTYPANTKTFNADTLYRVGNDLIVGFELEAHIATIGLNIQDDYIGFQLKEINYELSAVGVKRQTAIDEFTLLQLPVSDRGNFGEWLNVNWDQSVAVNVLGTDPYAKINSTPGKGYHLMRAGMENNVQLLGVGAALIVTEKDKLLFRIEQVEKDFNLPRGVESRRSKEYKYSYYEANGVTPQNIDEHIAFAKKGGFKAIQIGWGEFSRTHGHFPWRTEYANGIDDLRFVISKIKDAGMIAGAHFWYNKADTADLYVSPVPDHRLNLRRKFMLSAPLLINSENIYVEENPNGCTMSDGRKILKIGNELIKYSDYTTELPYHFIGCKRGVLNTKPSSYDRGFRFGLLDVDTWIKWIRFDQRTSIQDEVAQRLAKIYNDAGFDFAYFDGAEDVHRPYWFHTSMAQQKVYRHMDPKPIFAEGALKSHFNWHILTRGNAFDVFAPEAIKGATQKYQAVEAKYLASDFTSINFGWIDYILPDSSTVGMQPDMFEYVCSRGAAWDCPISLHGSLELFNAHPRSNDNFEVLRRWEEARIHNFLTNDQKKELQNLKQEHILLVNEDGEFELHVYDQIIDVAGGNKSIRAFVFDRSGETYIVYWHISGKSKLKLKASNIRLYKELGQQLEIQTVGEEVIIPVADRYFLHSDMPREEIIEAFKNAEIIEE